MKANCLQKNGGQDGLLMAPLRARKDKTQKNVNSKDLKPFIQPLVPFIIKLHRPAEIRNNAHRIKFRSEYERAIADLSKK